MTPEDLIRLALEQAALAAAAGEVPVGAVILAPDHTLLATGQNRRERDQDPTAHAEIVAIRIAAQKLGTWRLLGCTLAVTLEPCPMCAGAILNARIPHLIYGTPDPKAGATGTLLNLLQDPRLNHQTSITPNILTQDCAQILKSFFQLQRAQGKK